MYAIRSYYVAARAKVKPARDKAVKRRLEHGRELPVLELHDLQHYLVPLGVGIHLLVDLFPNDNVLVDGEGVNPKEGQRRAQ